MAAAACGSTGAVEAHGLSKIEERIITQMFEVFVLWVSQALYGVVST